MNCIKIEQQINRYLDLINTHILTLIGWWNLTERERETEGKYKILPRVYRLAQLEALSIKRMRRGKGQDGSGIFYACQCSPIFQQGMVNKSVGWVPAVSSEEESSSSKIKSFIYELWKLQTHFNKARGSLGVCIPGKSGKCLSKFYFDFSWQQKCFFPVGTDFFRAIIFLVHFLPFSLLSLTKKEEGGKSDKKKFLHSLFLPRQISLPILVWEPKSCNNGSSLLNLLKLCHLTGHGPDGQHGNRRILHPRAWEGSNNPLRLFPMASEFKVTK